MPKQKIAIISILKPVDDTRSFEKFSQTLAGISDIEIHNFGQNSSEGISHQPNIKIHPHSIQPRGLARIFTRVEVLFSLLKLKPQLIICNTHELLIVTVLNKILFGCKILYDIQENYNFNILYQGNFIYPFNRFLGAAVRTKETLLSYFFDHFILAEKCYKNELNFLHNKYSVIENKSIIPSTWKKEKTDPSTICILFSGTLTKSNGLYKALDLFEKMNAINEAIRFTIIGHCPVVEIWKLAHKKKYSFIEWKVSKTPISHEEILKKIKVSDFGWVGYELNPSNQNCMPTKVYEYAALGVWSIYEKGGAWSSYIDKNECGIQYDNKEELKDFIAKLFNLKESNHLSTISDASWKTEGEKLTRLVNFTLGLDE